MFVRINSKRKLTSERRLILFVNIEVGITNGFQFFKSSLALIPQITESWLSPQVSGKRPINACESCTYIR